MVENGIESINHQSEGSIAQEQAATASTNQTTSPSVTTSSLLPNNCYPLIHQVAGHFYGKGKTKLGLLQTNDGYVLKPVQTPPRGEREHNFFKRIFATDESQLKKHEIELKKLLPTYRGSLVHNEITYIKMDDAAFGIRNPTVIDFKIGKITYDPEASIEKIMRQKSKYPPVEKIGFQLIGMRVYNKNDNTFCHYDKIFGRTLSEEDLIHGLALYYQFHQTPQIQAIKETIKKFEEIKRWFEKQTEYHFFSSSLIVIYEANLEEILNEYLLLNSNDLADGVLSDSVKTKLIQQYNNNNNTNLVKIVMADFAHVFPAQNTLDQNYLFGLNRLIEHLKMLLSPSYAFKDVRNGN